MLLPLFSVAGAGVAVASGLAPASGLNCQLGRPLLSTSSAITGLVRTKLSIATVPVSRGSSFRRTSSACSCAMFLAVPPGALAKLTFCADSAICGSSAKLSGPSIRRSRPVAVLTLAINSAL